MINSGIYVLWLHLPKEAVLAVGSLGTFSFPPGIYAYVGSAQRNLQQRLARHRRAEKKLRWYIDYLRAQANCLGAVVFLGAPKDAECRLAEHIRQLPGASLPAGNFGASDCSCPAHLVHLSGLAPDLVALSHAVHNVQLGAAKSLAFFDAGD